MKLTILRYVRWLVVLAFVAIGLWLAIWHHHDRPPTIVLLALTLLAFVGNALKAIVRDSSS